MKKITLLLTVLLVFVNLGLFAQQTVYWINGSDNGNWWNDGTGSQLHWVQTTCGDPNPWVARPDYECGTTTGDENLETNNVIFDNNSNVSMNVNGAWFQINNITFELGASDARTLTSDFGGIGCLGNPSVFTNNSTATHVFKTGISLGASLQINASNGSFTFDNTIFLTTTNVTFLGDNTNNVNGDVTGTGTLTKEGDGLLILSGAKAYSGATTVSAGTLELQGNIASSDITVENGGTLKINGDNITVASLTVATGGIVNIEAGKSLTVTGDYDNSGTVTLKSTVTGTGSLIVNGTSTGNINAERYMSGAETWRLVSSPVTNHVISDVNNWTPTGSYEGGHGYDFYGYAEGTALWLNQKVGANNITSFTPAVGYLVSIEAADQTKYFESSINIGNVDVTVSKASSGDYSGANLIGNPYPSGIDWNLATRSLFDDEYAYVYDRVATEVGVTEGYQTVDGSVAGAYIAANQGFFVIKAGSGDGTFTFTNSMRVHNGTFYKSQTNIDKVVFLITNGSYYDETSIVLNDNSTYNRDRNDAIKMFSYNDNMPQIYTLSDDLRKVSINSIPNIDTKNVFKMAAEMPVAGEYIIKNTEVGPSFSDKVIFINDLKNGIIHNLTENGDYTFTSQEGDDPNRFTIHFGVVGIEDQMEAEDIQSYVHGNELTILGNTGATQLEIVNMQGQVVVRENIQLDGRFNKKLDLKSGIYIVRTNSTSNKVIIQN